MFPRLHAAPQSKPTRNEQGLLVIPDDQLLESFIASGDEKAFEALVVRHGPRVLGVCRSILRRTQDVEDAFQVTFLLLARKAATIRQRDSLGPWLHGVAHRLAVRSKVKASRRNALEGERRRIAMAVHHPGDELDREEVRRIVNEEIDRLPDRFRQPILLCYLQGLTNETAARHLGCPTSTLKERLGRAREILHHRLARRGMALSATLLLLLMPRTASAADVPRRLIQSTVLIATSHWWKRPRRASLAQAWGQPPSRLSLFALSAIAIVPVATAALYLSSPEKVGFLTWFMGAVRRVCH